MASRFDGQLGAFAYLLMILLYMPCVAATSAIVREVGRPWGMFAVGWTTALAYGTAVAVYQLGTLARHPQTSVAWLAGVAILFLGIVGVMRWMGRTGRLSHAPVITGGAQ